MVNSKHKKYYEISKRGTDHIQFRTSKKFHGGKGTKIEIIIDGPWDIF